MSGVFTTSSLYSLTTTPSKPRLQRCCIIPTWNSFGPNTNKTGNLPSLTFTCNFSSNPPPPECKLLLTATSSSALGVLAYCENESKNILDAFFLGKALAEAVTERIESTVGEFLSTVGRLQAEQQKQVQDFQEEVLERAKQAKEKAARETMETQGLISNSYAADTSTATAISASVASPRTNINSQPAEDSELGVSNGD